MITDRAEVKKGDILIYHTGYHRYYNGGPEEDEERYFLRHPGGDREFAEWIVEMELAWTGFDCGSGRPPDEHLDPLQAAGRPARRTRSRSARTSTRSSRRRTCSSCTGSRSRNGITHVENVGGDIEDALGQRCMIGAFPMPIEGGEASPCRVVAFIDE